MKKVLMVHNDGGSVLIVTHQLSLLSERHRQVRPVHIWTFLGAHANPSPVKKGERLFMAMENKLFGVRLARSRLRQSLSYVPDPCYAHGNVQDYDAEQQVMLDLEAYLNAIYSTLEIASILNRRQDPNLPQGFSKQGEKGRFSLFDFRHWAWLPLFYNLRTVFTHYDSSFPLLNEDSFEFNSSGRFKFSKGIQRVKFDAVLSFADNLFGLLDVWSLHKLQDVDPRATVFVIPSRSFFGPLRGRKTSAKPFLGLANKCHELMFNSPGFPNLKKLLSDIHIRCR